MGNGQTKQVFQLEALVEEHSDLWLADIRGVQCSSEYSVTMGYSGGMVDNIGKIVEEFMKYRGLVVNKIVVAGLPSSGKTEVAQKISEKCGVAHLQVNTLV